MIGVHINKARKQNSPSRAMHIAIKEEISRAKKFNINMSAGQIFVAGPHNYKETLKDEEKDEIKKIVDNTGISLIVHGTYLDAPWKGNLNSINLIRREIGVCKQIGAKGLVIHLAKHPIDTIVKVIGNIIKECDREQSDNCPILYLEINSAKKNDLTFDTPDKLEELFDKIKQDIDPDMKRVGLCIDTAHIFAAGTNMTTYADAEEWLDDLRAVPVKEIIVHLNDQKNDLGSGKDQHSALTYGEMWYKYNYSTGTKDMSDCGLLKFLEWIDDNNIITILERKEDIPKRNDNPKCSNVESDYILLNRLGFFLINETK